MPFASTALFLSYVMFALVASITPGPNAILLMASTANFGFRATFPHFAGVTLGCAAMTMLVGIGLAGVFAAAPWLYEIMRWGGAAYLLFLAYKIATATGMGTAREMGRPVTFIQAVAFQWVNPKAWSMSLSVIATFAPPEPTLWHIGMLTLIMTVIGVPCSFIWMGFGVGLKGVLSAPARLRIFNVGMALLLVLSLCPLLQDL